MKISYKKLWVMLIQREITKVQLRADVGISAGTMSKLNKGEDVALSVLLRICDYLNCDIGDICENGQGLSPVFRTAFMLLYKNKRPLCVSMR